jgi:hypothetical protein
VAEPIGFTISLPETGCCMNAQTTTPAPFVSPTPLSTPAQPKIWLTRANNLTMKPLGPLLALEGGAQWRSFWPRRAPRASHLSGIAFFSSRQCAKLTCRVALTSRQGITSAAPHFHPGCWLSDRQPGLYPGVPAAFRESVRIGCLSTWPARAFS